MEISNVVAALLLDISRENKEILVYKKFFSVIEKELFKQVMESYKFNQARACKYLGISRTHLRAKLERYFGNDYNSRSL